MVTIDRILTVGMAEDGVKVYPNPVTRNLLFDSSSELEVKVLSPDGRLYIQQKVKGSLNVEQLQVGVYIIQVNDGVQITTHRIVKAN